MSFVRANRNVLSTLMYPNATVDDVFPNPDDVNHDALSVAMDIVLQHNRSMQGDHNRMLYISHCFSETDNARYSGVRLVNSYGTPVLRVQRSGNFSVESYIGRLRERIRPNSTMESEKRSYIIAQMRKRIGNVVNDSHDVLINHGRNIIAQIENYARNKAYGGRNVNNNSSRSVNVSTINWMLRLIHNEVTELQVPSDVMNEINLMRSSVADSLAALKQTEITTALAASKKYWGIQYHPGHGFSLYQVNPYGGVSFNSRGMFPSLFTIPPTYYRSLSHLERVNPTVHSELMLSLHMLRAAHSGNPDYRMMRDIDTSSRADDISEFIRFGDYGNDEPFWSAGWYSDMVMSKGQAMFVEVL